MTLDNSVVWMAPFLIYINAHSTATLFLCIAQDPFATQQLETVDGIMLIAIIDC